MYELKVYRIRKDWRYINNCNSVLNVRYDLKILRIVIEMSTFILASLAIFE